MAEKDRIDAIGAVALVAFSLLLGINQVVIKLVNEALQPVFMAGLRSAGAGVLLAGWMAWRRVPVELPRHTLLPGLAIGTIFAAEFVCLFLALDRTSVTRVSVIFYAMPVWMALGAHLLLPGEAMTRAKAAGLALAVAGVAWAFADRDAGAVAPSATGDLLALLASMAWAGIALCARGTALREVSPPMQLAWQLGVSAIVLLALAPLFGPLVREFQPVHLWGVAFQVGIIAFGGFLFWLWLLTIYPASAVASFSFLAPLFGVGLGWLVLGEPLGPSILGALALVAAGLVLVNRPARSATPRPPG